jgi:type IV pilus assembly protein PilQ
MRMYRSRILCHAMTLIALLIFSGGCVKRMSAANQPGQTDASGLATLRSVAVSADASRVELASDKPFTYTSYKAGEPAKIIVDISQTEPGSVTTPMKVNRGNIRRIDLVRQPVGGGVLTRVEITLEKDVDFSVATDPADKTHLLISLVAPEADAKPLAREAKEAPLSEVQIEERNITPEVPAAVQPLPVQPAAEARPAGPAVEAQLQPAAAKTETQIEPTVPALRPEPAASVAAVAAALVPAAAGQAPTPQIPLRRLTAVSAAPDGVDLAIEGGVLTFNSFKLTKPDRIVLDLFGMKNAVGQNVVPIGALGIANARVGSTPDKVRIVLDALQESLPPFEVVKSDTGLKIRLNALAESRPAIAAAPAARVEAPAPRVEIPAAPVAAPAPRVEIPAAPVEAPSAPVAAPAPRVAAPAAPSRPPVPAPSAVAVEVPPASHAKGSLEALDFKIVEGVSRITLKLYGSCEPGKPVRGVQGLSLTIASCQVPKRLQRALDTSRFGSPVLSVTPYQVKVKGVSQAKLLVRLKGSPSFTVRRDGDLLVWDITNPGPLPVAQLPTPAARVKEAPAARKEAPEPRVAEELIPMPRPEDDMVTEIPSVQHVVKKVYKGRRVTLEFSDADVRKIFALIAEVSNLNFLIADDVTGTISIKLVNVPWDQALDVILDAKGLGMQREGNIVQIKPKARIQSQADEDLLAKKAAERGMELRTMVFEVNYASTSDVATQFTALKSERGTITKDDRTSRVIVKDIQSALDEMRGLLKTLDAPEKQVMIEARIVEASSNFTRDLGVQWGLHFKDGSASVLGINTVDSSFGGVVSPAGPGTSGSGGIGMGMSFGKLTSNIQLDMRLSAAATIGQVKIISTPKVVTLNNKAAKISQGQSIPYQTTSAEGTKTEFVEAALTLEVTPHITADGAVSMKIKASNNSPGSSASGPPPINKKEATTELVVANGETTVIGGIYVDSDTESDTGIPFLADIPLLGWLFKSNSKTKTRSELLIFITPKLVN